MTKIIKLSKNQVTEVDDIDFEWLIQDKWHAKWNDHVKGYYAVRSQKKGEYDPKTEKRSKVQMHRAIVARMLEEEGRLEELKRFIKNPTKFPVDHINQDTLKNTRDNLRAVSTRQNLQNTKRKSTSKYPGVNWHKSEKKWRASIRIDGKSIDLGHFKNEREAAKAYEKAVREQCKEELICKV